MHANLKIKHCLLFAVIFFLISLCNVYAEKENSSKCSSKKEFFVFGPKLSVNFSNEWISKTFKTDLLPGADFGLFFRFSIARFYIQPEIYYVIRNQSVNIWFGEMTESIRYQTHHVGIPLLLGVKAVDLRLFKLRFYAGPEFSLELKANNLEKMKYQLGFQAGLGFDIWRFTVDASYAFLSFIHPNRDSHSNIFKVGIGFKCF